MNAGWKNINEKKPPFAMQVFILGELGLDLFIARLKTYTDYNSLNFTEEHTLKIGDLYWEILNYRHKEKWTDFENFPYWIEKKELAKLSLASIKKNIMEDNEINDRFELLDIREKENV